MSKHEFLFTFTARGSLTIILDEEDGDLAYSEAKEAIESAHITKNAYPVRDFQIDARPDVYLEENKEEEDDEDFSLCMNPDCKRYQVFAGYPCRICETNTCVNCDTYYYIVNEETGGYITDPEQIVKYAGSLEGYVAHQKCADPSLRLD